MGAHLVETGPSKGSFKLPTSVHFSNKDPFTPLLPAHPNSNSISDALNNMSPSPPFLASRNQPTFAQIIVNGTKTSDRAQVGHPAPKSNGLSVPEAGGFNRQKSTYMMKPEDDKRMSPPSQEHIMTEDPKSITPDQQSAVSKGKETAWQVTFNSR